MPARGEQPPDDLWGAGREHAVQAMFDRVARRYALLNRLLTFGLDRRWRRRCIELLELPRGAAVADLACGTGEGCCDLQRAELAALGVDFSANMLRHATTTAPLLRADVLRLPLAGASLDGAVCGFALRNLADPEEFLAEAARVLRPGGRLGLLELCEPDHPLLRLGHRLYIGRIVPAVGGLVSDRVAYRYLPASLKLLPAPAVLAEQLRAAGFADVAHRRLSAGIAQVYTATRQGPGPPQPSAAPTQSPAAVANP